MWTGLILGIILATFILAWFFSWMWPRHEHLCDDIRLNSGYVQGFEPFVMGSGERAILMAHGIAGGPAQLRGVARELADAGFCVYAIVLPGHGTTPDDLFNIQWQHWYEHLEAEYLRISKKHKSVSLVSFSIGAALSLKLSSQYPVERLALLSTPVYCFSKYIPFGWFLKLGGFITKQVRTFPEDIPPEEGMPKRMIYRRMPIDAFKAAYNLSSNIKHWVKDIKIPVLILHSKKDVAAMYQGATFIMDNISSENKKLVLLEKSEHSIMFGEERDIVMKEILTFLKEDVS